jgi:hypothetical protein
MNEKDGFRSEREKEETGLGVSGGFKDNRKHGKILTSRNFKPGLIKPFFQRFSNAAVLLRFRSQKNFWRLVFLYTGSREKASRF